MIFDVSLFLIDVPRSAQEETKEKESSEKDRQTASGLSLTGQKVQVHQQNPEYSKGEKEECFSQPCAQ